MNKLKELWQYAVFRWCVYFTPLLVFGLLLKYGAFDFFYSAHGDTWIKCDHPYGFGLWEWRSDAVLIWVLILAVPAVWVWRRPIWKLVKQVWKLVKQALGFLNKKAEEG